MWFEVKGRFPGPGELGKAQALSTGTGLPAFVYFAEPAVPAPASLAEMTDEEFMNREEGWIWLDEYGWVQYSQGPAPWEIGLPPTAFRFGPRGPAGERKPRSNHWWWTRLPVLRAGDPETSGPGGMVPALRR